MINKLIDTIEILLFYIYIVLVYIFGGNSDTTYYYAIVLIILTAIELVKILKKGKFRWNNTITISIIFAFYCFISSFWSTYPTNAINRAKTLLLLSLSMFVGYNLFSNINKSYNVVLKLLLWAGVFFSGYILIYYGPTNYMQMLISGKRIGGEIANVNLIGLQSSISFLIALFLGTFENKKYYFVLILPLIIALGTGSRKALLTILLGAIAIIIIKLKNKITLKNILSIILYITIVIFAFNFISKIGIFSTVFTRFENMIDNYIYGEYGDGSMQDRNLLVKYGFEAFIKNPILGLGAGNASVVTYDVLGTNTYLHNNYIEILATLGIIGFLIYYSIYINIIKNFIVLLKKQKDVYLYFSIIFFVILLILDYGCVSYYSKNTYIYFLYGMLIVNEYRKRNGDQNLENTITKNIN